MKTLKAFIIVLAGVALIASCKTTTDSKSVPIKKWTVMLYLNGDDPVLEGDFIDAFRRMADAKVGSNIPVNIIIQFDRIPGHDTSYGDWPITNRYYLQPGMLPTMKDAIQDWGDGKPGREIMMDQPESLTGFIQWGKLNFPAERYALVVADHGFAWQGLSIDATSDDNYMFLPELKKAIIDGGVKFDVLALDACLMQTIEVAYELKKCSAGVMVGSQNPGSTWPFWTFLPMLLQNPDITAGQFGKNIVGTYSDWQKSNKDATLAVLDFNSLDSLTSSFGKLVNSMTHVSAFPEAQKAAQQVMDQIKQTIVTNKNHGEWDTIAHGLSIYFPQKTTLYRPEFFACYYIGKMTAFAEDEKWRDFLNSYYDPMSSKHPVIPEIYKIRPDMTTFVASDNIDLYDFCKRIVEYQ
jgi:hypothetical protein